MRYRAFRTKQDNRFYFQFLSEGDDVTLRSQSYESKEDCFNGIRSVITNSGNADRYERQEEDGKYFFVLKAANGQEIGRSVEYNSNDALTAAINAFIVEGPKSTSKSAESSEPAPKSAPPPPAAEKPYQETARGTEDYKPLAFYGSHSKDTQNGFASFNAEGEDWFSYNLGGEVVLISEGYASDKSRDKGIESVAKNMVLEARYQREVHPNGKHYFNLRAGNNQEIATSRWFDSEDEMNKVIGMLVRSKTGTWRSKRIYKDYRPLSFYQERITGEDVGFESFEEEGKYYFTLNHNNNPVLISEDYASEAGRDKGIDSVKRNVKNEKRYERQQHPNGNYYFNLLAGNKQEIATSRWFDSEKEMEKAINWLLSTGGTRRRKKPQREKKAPAERVYVKQSQSYPCSEITYDSFQSGGNKKYYFVFKNKDDKALLINGDAGGYKTTEALEKAVERVMTFAPDAKNYERRVTKNGKHYFVIKDDKNKTVARSSLFYPEKDAMEANIKLLACGLVLGASKGAAAAPVSFGSQKIVDDYLPHEAYAGDPGIHKFFHEERKEYYFSYNHPDGSTLLRSEGYNTEAGRENGIASVLKNAASDDRWSTGTVLDNKYHYFALKARNNQEIGRSRYYEDQAAMMADLNWTKGADSPIGAGSQEINGVRWSATALAAKAAEAAAKAKANTEAETANKAAAEAAKKQIHDDYMPCEAYAKGEGGFHSFYNEERKEYYFSYNHTDGTPLLRSEGYATEVARDNGIQSVKKNAPLKDRWVTGEVLNGRHHYYALHAGNNQEIARSCYYDDRPAMMAALALVQGENSPIGIGAGMVGGTMMSFAALSSRKAEEEKKAAAEAAAAAAALAAKKKEEEAARLAASAAAQLEAEEEEKRRAAAAAAAAALAARKKEETEAARLAAAEAKRKAEEEEKKKAVAAAALAATATTASTKSTENMEEYKSTPDNGGGGFPWWGWLLLLLALLALLWFFRGYFGCGETPPTPPIEVPIDSTDQEPPPPLGPDGAAMGFEMGTVPYDMASHLSDATSSFPRIFDLNKIAFRRDRADLNDDGKAELDEIIKVLQQYPDAQVDIYGYVGDNERSAYRGSKELTLDDVRARNIYNYLRDKGIDESRMSFAGDGGSSTTQAAIRLRSR